MYVFVHSLFVSSNFLDPLHPWQSLTLCMKLPVSSCCSSSFASLISSFLCLTVRSCVITILLNGLSTSLILFKFRNISHFFVSSSFVISSGLSLFCVAFPSLTAFLTSLPVISILQMFLHSSSIFWISSLLVSGSSLSNSGESKNYYILSSILSFPFFNIPALQRLLDYFLHFCACASYHWPWFVFFVLIP